VKSIEILLRKAMSGHLLGLRDAWWPSVERRQGLRVRRRRDAVSVPQYFESWQPAAVAAGFQRDESLDDEW
jgi:hypothetical protein